jgi:hypothetical protein
MGIVLQFTRKRRKSSKHGMQKYFVKRRHSDLNISVPISYGPPRAAPRFRKWGDKIISLASLAKKCFEFAPPPLLGGQKYNYSVT